MISTSIYIPNNKKPPVLTGGLGVTNKNLISFVIIIYILRFIVAFKIKINTRLSFINFNTPQFIRNQSSNKKYDKKKTEHYIYALTCNIEYRKNHENIYKTNSTQILKLRCFRFIQRFFSHNISPFIRIIKYIPRVYLTYRYMSSVFFIKKRIMQKYYSTKTTILTNQE